MVFTAPIIGPTLETSRLILRPPQLEDLDVWAALMADEEVTRYIGGVKTRPMVWRTLATMIGHWVLKGYSLFSVIEKETGDCLGRVGAWCPDGWPGTEVGWALARSAWGKGYATEAAITAIDWAFDAHGWSEVIHCIDPANTASVAVAKRLGSSVLRSGPLPPPLETMVVDVYGQSREEWRARQSIG
jgi:RimJ/RimL family protein N-acetyltransferase